MTLKEFEVLRGLYDAQGTLDIDHDPTARDVNQQIPHLSPREIGYVLRRLARRGIVVSTGRRHGGALKWICDRGVEIVEA